MSPQSARLSMAFSNIGHFFAHLLMMLYPTVVLGLEGKFGLTYGELISLSLAGYILFGVAALPAGWLGDRWSAEGMMVLFFFGSGGAAVATGLAAGPLGIACGLALIGVFGSIYHPVGVAWLVRNAENRGRALGWNGIFGSLGIGLAALIAGALTQLISWRAAFIIPGALCMAAGLALLAAVRAGTVVAATVDRRPEPEASRADVMRAFIVLSITMLGAGLVSQATTVALPKVFALRLAGLTNGGILGAGGFVSLVFLVSSAAQLVGGWLADRYPLKRVYVWCWAIQLPFFLLAARLVDLPLLGAVIAFQCLGVFATPAENSLLVRYTPARWRATAFGAKFVLALGVSSAGVPLVAITYDRTGDFFWLFLAMAFLALIIVAAAAFLPRERDRAPARVVVQPAE
ncbi:MAG: MFS transporter [Alphaproteobacteria bacterium]|nr:MFS transporter [Alphaproteobacteria bacterium]